MNAAWRLLTPEPGAPDSAGAVAIIDLEGDVDAALAACRIPPVSVGEVRVRDLLSIDRGVVARWSRSAVSLMPHGGPLIVRTLCAALTEAGIPRAGDVRTRRADAVPSLPELRELALDTLARAASPLAADVVLAHLERWEGRAAPGAETWSSAVSTPAELARARGRLLRPPLVAALGPANIGKSALLNALAGRSVSIVADEPGTTRDHVGVTLELEGLVVRYADTPGVRTPNAASPEAAELERQAAQLALAVVRTADLVLLCGDASAPPLDPAGFGLSGPSPLLLRVATRCDRGLPGWHADITTSAFTGAGLKDLARTIRDALVPPGALEDPTPWRFWES